MPQAVDSIASAVQQLGERILDLERRVAALEALKNDVPTAPELPATPLERAPRPATWGGFPPTELPIGVVPTLGKAVLGIAGAYLLRAIAESGSSSKVPVLVAGILYAGFWMGWAIRNHGASRFASVTYAVTSTLILSPLLVEATVRFRTLSPVFTAALMAAYVVLVITFSWREKLQWIPWIATLATVITAIALIIATHELVPFTAALLTIALATEAAACVGYRLSLRAISAPAADFAIWLCLSILASSEVPEGYRPATAITITLLCAALLAIYACSIGVRSFALRQCITVPEIAQAMLAFVLGAFGVLRANHGATAPALGILFLMFACLCYWGSLCRFTGESQTRNRRVSFIWAAALLLAASFLFFSANTQIEFLSLAAAAAALGYLRTHNFSLGVHASFFVAAATAVSPLPFYISDALAGNVPGIANWRLLMVIATAVLCYAIEARVPELRGRRHLISMIPAAVVGFAVAALAVVAVVRLPAGRLEMAASSLSVARTIVNCGLALALGYLGSHWRRIELRWVAYASLAFGTLKLLFEDLRFGNPATLVVSLLFYGMVLILLPRLTRHAQDEPA